MVVINVAEYIDREVLLQKAWDADTRVGYVQVVDVGDILDMPVADVTPVVHCKDCSWYQSVDDDGDDFEVCNYYNREVMGYQFCSEAEPYKTAEEKAEFRQSVGLDDESGNSKSKER